MSKSGTTDKPDPWRVPIAVAQIPDTGLHRDIDADQATRKAVADVGGLREVLSVQASFDVTPKSGGRYHVAGQVRARIGQTCVVTLDPIDGAIDEPVDLMFIPVEQLAQFSRPADDGPDGEAEAADSPEPIENGVIDLGRLATDVLYLAIDPYPRKANATFEPQVEAADPEDHPFAALKALRADFDMPAAEEAEGKSNAKSKRP